MLVRECVRQGVDVECLPGATAFVPALVASGLPNEKFCFEGFLPQKKGRQTRLKELALEYRTIIFYESPFRLLKTLTQFAEFFGTDRHISIPGNLQITRGNRTRLLRRSNSAFYRERTKG